MKVCQVKCVPLSNYGIKSLIKVARIAVNPDKLDLVDVVFSLLPERVADSILQKYRCKLQLASLFLKDRLVINLDQLCLVFISFFFSYLVRVLNKVLQGFIRLSIHT